jgi:hypothetical protein
MTIWRDVRVWAPRARLSSGRRPTELYTAEHEVLSLPAPALAAEHRPGPALGLGWRDIQVGGLVTILAVILLSVTARDISLTWDEPVCLVSAESYVAWFNQLIHNPGYALSERGIADY